MVDQCADCKKRRDNGGGATNHLQGQSKQGPGFHQHLVAQTWQADGLACCNMVTGRYHGGLLEYRQQGI